jgi:uncharacterized protein with HEPN domain
MYSIRAMERIRVIDKKIGFIAHDYEGIDLYIVENVIEERLPVIKQGIKKILDL